MEQIDIKIVEDAKPPMSMHPKKFAMWVFLASVLMVFASLTSAYIVRQADGNWTYFEMPMAFYLTTVVILLSSVTMQWAYFAAKKDNIDTTRIMVWLTLILGLGFCAGQYYGWAQLVQSRVYLVGNPSGSFVYVLTFLHGLHIISALVYLVVVLRSIALSKVHSKNLVQMEMCATFWHFLGVLWLYLFVFLLLTR